MVENKNSIIMKQKGIPMILLHVGISQLMKSIPNGTQKYSGIEYTQYNGKSIKLDLYLPPGKQEHPLIVWIHGGGFEMGNRNMIEPGALSQLRRGYALASLSYSLTDEEIWPVQAHEIKAGVRWLRANSHRYGIDPEKFIAWGNSAGGHLASILGTSAGAENLEDMGLGNKEYGSDVQAVVAWYPPVNFFKLGGWHSNRFSPESKLIGGLIAEMSEQVVSANPITHISINTPPFYIMHGQKDSLVSYHQSEMLHEALLSKGIESHLVLPKTYVHADFRFNTGSRIKAIENFLDEHFR